MKLNVAWNYLYFQLILGCCNCTAKGKTFIAPPQNMTVTRGSNVTISCEHVIANSSPVTWIINGTSFSQEQIFFSPSYQQYRQTTPTENSLTVFSINHTTTFQCVVHSIPVTTSTLGTINVIASNFITPPQNMSVTKGSNVTISCGHVIASPRPVTWIINGTSFDQEYIFFSQIYQQNRQAAPTENSLTVFSINHTTTFQCVIHLNPTTTSTLGTISVFDPFILQNCNVTSPSIGAIKVSCDSLHQFLVILTSTNNCNNPMETSTGSSPLIVTGLDPGVTYIVTISFFDRNQVVLRDQTVAKTIKVMSESSSSDSDSLFTGAALVIGCIVTSIVTLLVTAIITIVVTYICVKKFSQDKSGKQKVAATSALVYDTVGQTNMESKEADLELQQNPAYGISHMDSNIRSL